LIAFALVVVDHPEDPEYFALVHEKGERGWWLPGGGVDMGQTLTEAAQRECAEEAGSDVEITGLLRFEYCGEIGRLRAIFSGKPRSGPRKLDLKEVPDSESKGAAWATFEDCQALDRKESPWDDGWLRGPEPLWWAGYIADARGQSMRFASGAAFMRAERRGAPPPPWPGPGDPPRAVYPTDVRVQVLFLPDADRSQVVVTDAKTLPTAICFTMDHLVGRAHNLLENMVNDLMIGEDSRVVGVAGIEHTVDTTNLDRPTAELLVSFVALPCAEVEVEPSNGYHLDALANRKDLPCRIVLEKGVEPLSILGDERETPPDLKDVKRMVNDLVDWGLRSDGAPL
jgi:8-oxo-dGTP pyrophosphatase MutT (NUDIX family)